jgi:hypothetical protein
MDRGFFDQPNSHKHNYTDKRRQRCIAKPAVISLRKLLIYIRRQLLT